VQADDRDGRPDPDEPARPDHRPGRPGETRDGSRPVRGRGGSGWKFGPASTRRAVILALVVCALALSVAVPLRNYLGQRSELAEMQQQQQRLREQVDELERRKAELQDPAQVEAEARRRLRYVHPGETPYIVQLPEASPPPTPTPTPGEAPPDPGAGTER